MKRTILALAVAGALMLAGCGGGGGGATMSGGPSGGGPAPTTWEQLPTVVDRMDFRASIATEASPWPTCATLADCQAIVKSMIGSATEPTGTMRRFRGTRTVRTSGGDTATETYYGGWLDNSVFVVSTTESTTPISGRTWWNNWLSMGIRDTTPVAGVYRGEAVDALGRAGTSELNYTSNATGGQLDLTISGIRRIENGDMVWRNVPVDDDGRINNAGTFDNTALGPQLLRGSFYQGGEVGGQFYFRSTLDPPTGVRGAFGAELTPASP